MDYEAIERLATRERAKSGRDTVYIRERPKLTAQAFTGVVNCDDVPVERTYRCEFDGVNPRPRIELA